MSAARRRPLPYLLLLPGLLWLALFFVVPLYYMGELSLRSGSLTEGFEMTWAFSNYGVVADYSAQFLRSFGYAAVATAIALLIAYPLSYFIAFRGGKYKNLLLFLVVAPFFTTYLIRTIAWQTILTDESPLVQGLSSIGLSSNGRILDTPASVIAGLTYNFLPFMILPLYTSLDTLDRRLIEAAKDLYASARTAFFKVTLPLTAPGIVAGTLLTFIPAAGDYVNAFFLGSRNQAMIGNVIQNNYLVTSNYPDAAALSFVLLTVILILVVIYIRFAGSEALMGDEAGTR